MDKVEALPSITRLSDKVVRVLGQNPGKFTLQGTNTYIIGRTNPYVLLDTGVGEPAYPAVLKDAFLTTAGVAHPTQPLVSDIILTHRHHDHVDGLPHVLQLLRELWATQNPDSAFPGPRVHKFPLPPSDADAHLQELADKLPKDILTLPSVSSAELGVFHPLSDGQNFALPSDPTDTLQILHTPGHTTDSIALLFSADRALFTGDSVLGQGTAVFEDLAAYLASLRKMLWAGKSASGNGDAGGYGILYPSHGPVVKEGWQTIKMYIEHRLEREGQVVGVLKQSREGEGGSAWTTWGITERLYKQYPVGLWEPAARVLDLHLRKLEKEGRVKSLGGEGKDRTWVLIEKKDPEEDP